MFSSLGIALDAQVRWVECREFKVAYIYVDEVSILTISQPNFHKGARGFIIEHDNYAGLLCFGTQANSTDLNSPNAPLLMFSGELDGLSVTEFQPFYKNYLAMQRTDGDLKALKERAVVIAPGLSHSDFCPGFDVPTDCYSELTPAEALKDIGDVCAAWLELQVSDPKSAKAVAASKTLLGWTEKTNEFLEPFMKLSAMEESSWCAGGFSWC